MSRAASHFLLNQLPELYAGVQRGSTNFPVQYLGANVPQAWAAGSAFALLQVMTGLLPDAPRERLFIDPLLPPWLPDITMTDLRIGRAIYDIRFWRDREETRFEVLKGDSDRVFRRSFSALSDHLKAGTREP